MNLNNYTLEELLVQAEPDTLAGAIAMHLNNLEYPLEKYIDSLEDTKVLEREIELVQAQVDSLTETLYNTRDCLARLRTKLFDITGTALKNLEGKYTRIDNIKELLAMQNEYAPDMDCTGIMVLLENNIPLEVWATEQSQAYSPLCKYQRVY